jgi:pre-mRNA-splicing helicase BRR2
MFVMPVALQSPTEQSVVNMLFEQGAIQVVVATAPTVWGMTVSAHLVVICGTQHYDPTGAGGGAASDYPVSADYTHGAEVDMLSSYQ